MLAWLSELASIDWLNLAPMSALLQAEPQSGQRSMIRGKPSPSGPPKPAPTVSFASPNGPRVGANAGSHDWR